MTLRPKKIKYSSKQGLTFEWQRPDELVIDADDMMVMVLILRGYLDGDEMNRLFKPAEQEVIERFVLETEKKQQALLGDYAKKPSLKKIKSDFRNCLDWWIFYYQEGIMAVMTQIWGWKLTAKETLPLTDRLVLSALETDVHKDLARIKYMIGSYLGNPKLTDPLPETVAKIEAVFGPLDWVEIKEEGKARYEKLYGKRENQGP